MRTSVISASLLLFIGLASCRSFKVDAPPALSENSEKMHVKGTSVSIFGHKIKIEGFGEGKMHSGFTYSHRTEKRLYLLYFDLDKRLNYISNHFSKEINRSKTKFHFDLAGNGFYATTYCLARTVKSSLAIKNADMGVRLSEEYNFNGVIFTNWDAAPWRLYFNGSRNTRDGLPGMLKNVRNNDGILTNDSASIEVKLVRYNSGRNDNMNNDGIQLKIPVGYEFVANNQSLAFVDMFDKNIWVSKAVDEKTRLILISAAVSILVKKDA